MTACHLRVDKFINKVRGGEASRRPQRHSNSTTNNKMEKRMKNTGRGLGPAYLLAGGALQMYLAI